MTRLMRTMVLALVCLAGAARLAEACSCYRQGPACEAAWLVKSVFTAEVVSIEAGVTPNQGDSLPTARVRLRVIESFINMPSAEAVVEWSPLNTCAFGFRRGERYLVYAHETEPRLIVGICSRTRRLANAKEDLAYLRSLPTKAPVSRVFGRITERSRHPAEPHEVDYGPMANVRVSISGDGFARDVMTDDDGRYEVTNVPVGTVDIKVDVPFSVRPGADDWRIRDPRGCVAADFDVSPVATATGRVVNAHGQPIAGVAVDAVAAELAGHFPEEMHVRAVSDAHGIFTFDDLPPGGYVFGLNLTKPKGNASAAAPIYMPGPDRARAAVVTLAPGDRRDVGTLRVSTPEP
jgi:hypothetical protein